MAWKLSHTVVNTVLSISVNLMIIHILHLCFLIGILQQPLKEDQRKVIEDTVKEVQKHAPLNGLGISEDERKMILQWGQSNGLTQGHWFKCPEG